MKTLWKQVKIFGLILTLFSEICLYAALEDLPPQDYKRVLSIAGSDSGGGAGIQADLKTFSALGCYGMTAITLITSQNTLGVTDIELLPPRLISSQVEAVLSDIRADTIKIGALGAAANIECVASALQKEPKHFKGSIVLDPVLITKGGHPLVSSDHIEDFVSLLIKKLFPLSTIVTPNKHEALKLLSISSFTSRQDVEKGALTLLSYGAHAVVIKGCGFDDRLSEDCLVLKGDKPIWLSSPKIPLSNLHGTGCTFSAALASYLSHSFSITDATHQAKRFLEAALKASEKYKCGQGINPVNHLCSIEKPWTQFVDIWEDVKIDISKILRVPFHQSIADDSVTKDQFFFYLHQDYIFLNTRDALYQFIYQQMVERDFPLEEQEYMKKKLSPVKDAPHKKAFFDKYDTAHPATFSADFWYTLKFEAHTTIDYTMFLNREASHGLEQALAAVLPCATVYQELGEFIKTQQALKDLQNNKYQKWIDTYSSPQRRTNITAFIQLVDTVARRSDFDTRASMRRIFKEGVQQELKFSQGILEHFPQFLKEVGQQKSIQ